MFEAAAEALSQLLDPSRIGWLLLGTAVGFLVGMLPGLGGTVGMSILLPFIFGMDPYSGVALLIGMAAAVHTGDLFPSILLGVPGSSGSQATIMDGYPMARAGQAARAIGASLSASMIGGILGAVTLFGTIAIARPLILALRSPELFMLTLIGLATVGILARGSLMAGVLSGMIGLLLGTVGAAPATADYRFTFGSLYLWDGIPLAVLALGLFALPELLDLLTTNQAISRSAKLAGSFVTGIRDTLRHGFLVLRSSVIGAIVGLVPGLGGSVVDWISYGLAQRTCRNTEDFGKGDVRGVIAPESSNNAKEGGALIPTLLFGIPGSGTTAVLLGGLILLGLEAGPSMVRRDLDVTLTIVWTLALANVVAAFAGLFLSGAIARISIIPAHKLVPFLFVAMIVAAYQSSRHWGDIIAFLAIGVLGWVLKQLGWPRAPLLIGFVLASGAERYLHLSMSRYGTDWLTYPTVLALGVVILFLVAGGGLYKKRRGDVGAAPDDARARDEVSGR